MDSLPRNHFRAILADPPWRFGTWDKQDAVQARERHSRQGTTISASVHYQTMTTADIKALPICDLAASDCALFLWVCWPNLLDAIETIKAWGFEYKTCAFSWTKAHAGQIDMFRDDADALMGMGYWTRAN